MVWLGRHGVPWNVLLEADFEEPPAASEVRDRLSRLCVSWGWRSPGGDSVAEGTTEELLARLAGIEESDDPVSAGVTPHGLLLRAHHAAVDGIGLLAVLSALTDRPVRSSARGVADRPQRSALSTAVARVRELALRPPAPVAGDPAPGATGDTFASAVVPVALRTAELSHAAIAAVTEWNAAAGVRSRRVALAVGVSTVGGERPQIGDDSGFLRLTDVERMTAEDLRAAMSAAPLQVGGTARSGFTRFAGPVITWASTRFSDRLGSTLLVSHLGTVEAEGLGGIAFYPLAGTGSEVSLGAATVRGRTTVTLRARGARHSSEDLRDLLASIVARTTRHAPRR